MANDRLTQSPFLRVDDVAKLTGRCAREIWRMSSAEPGFPRPRKLSPKRTVWLRSDVEAWMTKQLAEMAGRIK